MFVRSVLRGRKILNVPLRRHSAVVRLWYTTLDDVNIRITAAVYVDIYTPTVLTFPCRVVRSLNKYSTTQPSFERLPLGEVTTLFHSNSPKPLCCAASVSRAVLARALFAMCFVPSRKPGIGKVWRFSQQRKKRRSKLDFRQEPPIAEGSPMA